MSDLWNERSGDTAEEWSCQVPDEALVSLWPWALVNSALYLRLDVCLIPCRGCNRGMALESPRWSHFRCARKDDEVGKALSCRIIMKSHVFYEVIKVSIFPRYSPLGSNECVFKNRVRKQFLWGCNSGVILFMHNYLDRVHNLGFIMVTTVSDKMLL